MKMPTKLWSKQLKKKSKEKFDFLIDLSTIIMVAKDTKSTKDEPQTFTEAWINPNPKSWKKWQKATWKKAGMEEDG